MTLTRYQERQLWGVWPRLLVEHGKHGQTFYLAPDRHELFKVSLTILKQRLKDQYLYDEDATRAREVIRARDGEAAWVLLLGRNDAEYERLELTEFENLREKK